MILPRHLSVHVYTNGFRIILVSIRDPDDDCEERGKTYAVPERAEREEEVDRAWGTRSEGMPIKWQRGIYRARAQTNRARDHGGRRVVAGS